MSVAPIPALPGLCDEHTRLLIEALAKGEPRTTCQDRLYLMECIGSRHRITSDMKDPLRRVVGRIADILGGLLPRIPACEHCQSGVSVTEAAVTAFFFVCLRTFMSAAPYPTAWRAENIAWWDDTGCLLRPICRVKWIIPVITDAVGLAMPRYRLPRRRAMKRERGGEDTVRIRLCVVAPEGIQPDRVYNLYVVPEPLSV